MHMGECTPGYTEIAKTLGGIDCAHAASVVSVRDPFSLTNWTLPVVETLVIAGAVVSLIHAVRWWRRRGDPSNLALWLASVVYVLILEPPLYFPDRFGLADSVGLIFVHNVFTVQFLDDRLPLYILSLYPALTYLAYALVQRTGILDRRNPLVGAACVAFVFHCFYEIFDHLGPQLQWWAWNPAAASNTPWLASVPLSSATIFAGASPFGFALLTRLLVVRRAARGPVPRWSMTLRVIGVGVLTPLAMMVFSVPYGLASLGHPANVAAQEVALWLVIAVFAAVAVSAFVRAARESTKTLTGDRFLDRYAIVAAAVYLLVFAALWVSALPAYLAASDGRTPSGTPIGSLWYASACAVACVGVLVALWQQNRARHSVAG